MKITVILILITTFTFCTNTPNEQKSLVNTILTTCKTALNPQHPDLPALLTCAELVLLTPPEILDLEDVQLAVEISDSLSNPVPSDFLLAAASFGLRRFIQRIQLGRCKIAVIPKKLQVFLTKAVTAQPVSLEHRVARLVLCADAVDYALRDACLEALREEDAGNFKFSDGRFRHVIAALVEKNDASPEELALIEQVARGAAKLASEKEAVELENIVQGAEARLVEALVEAVEDSTLHVKDKQLAKKAERMKEFTEPFLSKFPTQEDRVKNLEIVKGVLVKNQYLRRVLKYLVKLREDADRGDVRSLEKRAPQVDEANFDQMVKATSNPELIRLFLKDQAVRVLRRVWNWKEIQLLLTDNIAAVDLSVSENIRTRRLAFKKHFIPALNLAVELSDMFGIDEALPILARVVGTQAQVIAIAVAETRLGYKDFKASLTELEGAIAQFSDRELLKELRSRVNELYSIENFSLHLADERNRNHAAKFRLWRTALQLGSCWETVFRSHESCTDIKSQFYVCADDLVFPQSDIDLAEASTAYISANAEFDPPDIQVFSKIEQILRSVYTVDVADVFRSIAHAFAKYGEACQNKLDLVVLFNAHIEATRNSLTGSFPALQRIQGLPELSFNVQLVQAAIKAGSYIEAVVDFEDITEVITVYEHLAQDEARLIGNLEESLTESPVLTEAKHLFANGANEVVNDFLGIVRSHGTASLKAQIEKLDSRPVPEAGAEPQTNQQQPVTLSLLTVSYIEAQVQALNLAFDRLKANWETLQNQDLILAANLLKYLPHITTPDVEPMRLAILATPKCFAFSKRRFFHAVADFQNIGLGEQVRSGAHRIVRLHVTRLGFCRKIAEAVEAHGGAAPDLRFLLDDADKALQTVDHLEPEVRVVTDPNDNTVHNDDEEDSLPMNHPSTKKSRIAEFVILTLSSIAILATTIFVIFFL